MKRPSVLLKWKPYIKNITLMGILSSLDIGLSNWSLVFITVSLYTMSKSTALIFILIFAIIFKLEQPRVSQVGVVILIVTGLIMFTFESTSFELEGFLLVMAASLVTGLRWTVAQMTIQKADLHLSNPVDTVYHLQPVMLLTLLPLAFYIDGVHMGSSRQIFLASDAHKVIWTGLYLFAAALLAFMLGVSEYLLVYHTSGLTLSISGVVKEIIILTISTTAIEENNLSPLNTAGMVVCILGVALHATMKAHRARVESAKEEISRSQEDQKKLISSGDDRLQEEDEESESDNSIVLYETKL